jgi:3-phenylpropionate/trans-cinnamate dioxygenase ferredoxin reductase component
LDSIAIVGASLAGLEAAKELRTSGFAGELVVFGAEPHLPYDRPPLSKELLGGQVGVDQVRLDLGAAADAAWHVSSRVTRMDAHKRALTVDGVTEMFDGIVIATGATARRPSFADARGDLAGVHVVRTLDDCLALADDLRRGPGRVLVVGGGFIGAEVASTCRALGLEVTVVEGLGAPMERALGHHMGEILGEIQREHGVDLRVGASVIDIDGAGRVGRARLTDDTVLDVDVVVLAIGVQPATDWLADSGLALQNGVLCDQTCLAAPGIVAAGDVARWPNPRFGEVRRVEHWDNAIRQGRHAAKRLLAGDDPAKREPYAPVPWVWSDQFGSKLQAIGSPAQHDEFRIVSGGVAARKLAGAYRRGDRLVGAVALNSPRTIIAARELLMNGATWAEALDRLNPR